jgi:hypothetical protein
MAHKTMTQATAALLLTLACSGAALAQGCPCNAAGTRTASAAALTSLLSNKMVCGSVGGDSWQEWHNGSSSGVVVDYKMGPSHPNDPSTTVGTYAVNADNTVTYTYGSQTYKYAVCSTARSIYTFCGAVYGGRDLPNTVVGGSGGLQSCVAVAGAVKNPGQTAR